MGCTNTKPETISDDDLVKVFGNYISKEKTKVPVDKPTAERKSENDSSKKRLSFNKNKEPQPTNQVVQNNITEENKGSPLNTVGSSSNPRNSIRRPSIKEISEEIDRLSMELGDRKSDYNSPESHRRHSFKDNERRPSIRRRSESGSNTELFRSPSLHSNLSSPDLEFSNEKEKSASPLTVNDIVRNSISKVTSSNSNKFKSLSTKSPVIIKDSLLKRNVSKNEESWNSRYFVLYENSDLLYFDSVQEYSSGVEPKLPKFNLKQKLESKMPQILKISSDIISVSVLNETREFKFTSESQRDKIFNFIQTLTK